jgi:hypothetical protein
VLSTQWEVSALRRLAQQQMPEWSYELMEVLFQAAQGLVLGYVLVLLVMPSRLPIYVMQTHTSAPEQIIIEISACLEAVRLSARS